jgi:dephospho-CoA kinase
LPKKARKRPFRIGLTGSIGMGKTTTAKMFGKLRIPVYHADDAVHALYAKGGAAIPKIARAFPGAVKRGKVDRKALSRLVGKDKRALKRLENIVHPLVARERRKFLSEAAREGARFVVLDIPLLFETGSEKSVDAVVVVSASRQVQRKRVLAREGMTARKFAQLHARQVPDAEKRAKADFVIETDKGLPHAFAGVKRVVAALRTAAKQKPDSG